MDESKVVQLAKLGRQLRQAQKDYFLTRTTVALEESKRLERQFDRACDEAIDQQGKLFDL